MVDQPANLVDSRLREETPPVIAWQTKLLPLMMGTLVVLTIFFCVSNIIQLYTINSHIQHHHELNLNSALGLLQSDEHTTASERLEFARWRTQAILEAHALQYRYHQAGITAMSRVYIVYLGFVTGMVLAMVGATFILGKMREPQANLATDSLLLRVSVTSASPGLILALLGTILMLATIYARSDIRVRDGALYVPRPTQQSTTEEPRSMDEIADDVERELNQNDNQNNGQKVSPDKSK